MNLIAIELKNFKSIPASPLPSPMRSPAKPPQPSTPQQPCCVALYDFDAENPGELEFKVCQIFKIFREFNMN